MVSELVRAVLLEQHKPVLNTNVPVAGKGDEAQELNYLMLGRGNES